MAQLIKNPPAMQETWGQSLGWEEPLEKGKATHSSILAKQERLRSVKNHERQRRLGPKAEWRKVCSGECQVS